jgi:hypothetical protein
MDRFEVKIAWDDESRTWGAVCSSLKIYGDFDTLFELRRGVSLAAEDIRELEGESLDFVLDFKIKTPKMEHLIVDKVAA